MREALRPPRKGRSPASPNPLVGAIPVRDGEIVGRGFHTHAGLHHAEIIAPAQAGEMARGATLYLNLEPCSHQAAHLLRRCVDQAGVARRRARHRPQPLVAGQGFARRREAGIEVEIPSDFAAEAEKLNEPFLHHGTGRPLVTLKRLHHAGLARSPPRTTIAAGLPANALAPTCRKSAHDHDAILTGIGTVLADDCLLSDRTGHSRCRPLLHRDGFPCSACRWIPKWRAAPVAMCW